MVAGFFLPMASFFPSGPSEALRRGAFGLVLAMPLLAAPVSAQTSEQKTQPPVEEALVKDDVPSEQEPRVLITEVIIEGIAGHPEKERVELAAYDAMVVRPGSRVTRDELKRDLDAIYATGWFSDVRIEPVDGPLGVQIVVQVQPNPLLTKVELDPPDAELPESIVEQTFSPDYDRTLNLNELKARIKQLQQWYAKEGYSLARVTGPTRITPEGVVQLKVVQGTVAGVEVRFLNKEGDATNEKGEPISGKTKPWVITREISIKPGEVFNRNQLEADIKRLYSTSLFSDVKVTLKPVAGEPGNVTIILGVVEQSTGSLSGGLGYSQSQGVFGQVQLQDSNLLGRAWNMALNITYGQYGGLGSITFSDPWIKGDDHRTSLRASVFLSREVPQIFQSQESGNIRTVEDYYDGGSSYAYRIDDKHNPAGRKFDSVSEAEKEDPNTSWFDYEGNSVALQRVGGSIIFARPLNGGDPYKKAAWNLLAGLNVQSIRPINFAGDSRPYGAADVKEKGASDDDVICIAFDCADENNLLGVRVAATYNNLNDPRNPTSGNFFSFGTEQFVSVGEHSPTFNRIRTSYTHFIPVNWLKIAKGCRPKSGEKANCPQSIAFQVKAGTIVGQLPPYEAFCLGGSNSVRGWNDCDLAVGRSFTEATIEYRFPIWNIIAGELFVDGGTDLGSQGNVPGKPGDILDKPGSGFSVGSGLIVTTPVGPLRLEVATQDFTDEWRFNLGVGWKF